MAKINKANSAEAAARSEAAAALELAAAEMAQAAAVLVSVSAACIGTHRVDAQGSKQTPRPSLKQHAHTTRNKRTRSKSNRFCSERPKNAPLSEPMSLHCVYYQAGEGCSTELSSCRQLESEPSNASAVNAAHNIQRTESAEAHCLGWIESGQAR
eukprot:1179936-Prorocentrum_minimum.AAC.2